MAHYQVDCSVNINTQVTIDAAGNVFFGSWGVIRNSASTEPTERAKYDGALHGLNWDLSEQLWSPVDPGLVPYCYEYLDRVGGTFCPSSQLNGYDGMINGAGAMGPNGLIFYGRGDGTLYALDSMLGSVSWQFETYNPIEPDDPEGGGHIVTPPLVADGVAYFATRAPTDGESGQWQTNAIYGVTLDTQGSEHFRYPSVAATLPGEGFLAAPVLSPDGQTVTFASFHNSSQPAIAPFRLFAFHTGLPADAREEDRIAWIQEMSDPAVANTTISIQRMLVDADGNYYIAGTRMIRTSEYEPFTGAQAVVLALNPTGYPLWGQAVELSPVLDGTAVYGLSLWEVGGTAEVLYVGQGFNDERGGALWALNPATGSVEWTWRAAENEVSGQVYDPTVDPDGVIYFGVRGSEEQGGWIFALDSTGRELWRYHNEGPIEWSSPAIGHQGTLYFGDRAVDGVPTDLFEPTGCDDDLAATLHAIFLYDVGDADGLEFADTVQADVGEDTSDIDEATDVSETTVFVDGGFSAPPSREDDEGCGCRQSANPPASTAVWAAMIAFLGWHWRRRPSVVRARNRR